MNTRDELQVIKEKKKELAKEINRLTDMEEEITEKRKRMEVTQDEEQNNSVQD